MQRFARLILLPMIALVSSCGMRHDYAYGWAEPVQREYASAASESAGSYAQPLVVADEPLGDRDLGDGADREPFGCVIMPRPPHDPAGGEAYDSLRDNPFKLVSYGHDSSTFSTDVDTASYSNIRRFLQQHGQLPPRDAVRIEEMINYFDYDYAAPTGDHPFSMHPQLSPCPWRSSNRILRVGIQGALPAQRPQTTLVFLIDVSGSMDNEQKLGLVIKSFKLLVDQLDERDTVAIVTYAGRAGIALEPTSGDRKGTILAAIEKLHAGGSTAGAAGIREAYRLARAHQATDGQTRVILATDGDFNVGVTNQDELVELIRQEAEGGIFLNVLGVGSGNYQDARMERISNDGNGTYAYIDSIREARKYFGEDLLGNLVTIAKDVKVQLFFNPTQVQAWRLIGYANRLLKKEDFNNDRVDAGEIGAGLQVTALYEIVPVGAPLPGTVADENPFIAPTVDLTQTVADHAETLCRLRLRYKPLTSETSILLEQDVAATSAEADRDSRWAMAMAGFGMLLRNSVYSGTLGWNEVITLAKSARGADDNGHRAEAIRLMEIARDLRHR